MDATAAKDPQLLAHYEGLILKTAGLNARYVEEEFEDICQFLRVRVWKALLAFDPAALRVQPTTQKELEKSRDKYVFICVTNAVKDVLKKKRHNLLFIEDIASAEEHGIEANNGQRAKFEERYLCSEEIEIDDEPPLIPSTLTKTERSVLQLLYVGYKPAEIAGKIGLPRSEVSSATKAIREKMADWSPGALDRPLAVAA